jgi:NodT family efflux transporter outer membrane factor (OMF) lipoprotein
MATRCGGGLGLVGVLLASCTVGPNFSPPHEAVMNHFTPAVVPPDKTGSGGRPGPTATEAEPDSAWWRKFRDPVLDELEAHAAAGNLDLKTAYLRIVEARIQILSVRAQGLPSLSANAAVTREQLGLAGILKTDGGVTSITTSASGEQLIHQLEAPVNLYQLGFDASWELDIFGKVRRGIEGAKAQRDSAVESRNDLVVSLEAEVAQTYFRLRAGQTLRRITLDLIASQSDVVELTTSLQTHGLGSEADVQSARGQLSSLQSQLPTQDQAIAVARHALAVLCGELPDVLDAQFGNEGELPALPALVPVGLPSALARRRPDIRNAEDSLHAATADIGVAVASLYPDITLAGTDGLRNTGTRYLTNWSSNFYTFGPKISLPIFQGGALVANVRLARARAAEAALTYRSTVLGALQEVEDDLVALQTDAQRSTSLTQTVVADQRAVDVDLDAYRHGLITYLNVLTAQIQLVQARQQLAQSLLTQSTDLVALYKALGGGWEAPADAVAAAPHSREDTVARGVSPN